MEKEQHVKGVKTLKRTTQLRDHLELLNLAIDLSDKYGVEKLQKVMDVLNDNPHEVEEAKAQRATSCCAGGKWMLCGSMFRASLA